MKNNTLFDNYFPYTITLGPWQEYFPPSVFSNLSQWIKISTENMWKKRDYEAGKLNLAPLPKLETDYSYGFESEEEYHYFLRVDKYLALSAMQKTLELNEFPIEFDSGDISSVAAFKDEQKAEEKWLLTGTGEAFFEEDEENFK